MISQHLQGLRKCQTGSPTTATVAFGMCVALSAHRLQVTGGADLFIGFGGVVERPLVAAEADWYVYKYNQLIDTLRRYTVREGRTPI